MTAVSTLGIDLAKNIFSVHGVDVDGVVTVRREIRMSVRDNELARRAHTRPGIGPLTASALVATVGHGRDFKHGRQFAVGARSAAAPRLSPPLRAGAVTTLLGPDEPACHPGGRHRPISFPVKDTV